MKIIAKTDDGFILSASKVEVAMITGDKYASHLEKAGIGSSIDVNSLFMAYEKIMGNKHSVSKMVECANDIIASCKSVLPLLPTSP